MGVPASALYLLLKSNLTESLREVVKARTTKYLRRYKGKDGKWRYIYPSKSGGKQRSRHEGHETTHSKVLGDSSDKHYHAGASFAAGKGKGHYVIEASEGGQVIFYLDEDATGKRGETQTMSRKDFRHMLREEHREEFEKAAKEGLKRRQDLYLECILGGVATDKQIKRAADEVARWQKANKSYLKSEDKKALGAARGKLFAEAKKQGISNDELREMLGVSSMSDNAGEVTAEMLDGMREKLASGNYKHPDEIKEQDRYARNISSGAWSSNWTPVDEESKRSIEAAQEASRRRTKTLKPPPVEDRERISGEAIYKKQVVELFQQSKSDPNVVAIRQKSGGSPRWITRDQLETKGVPSATQDTPTNDDLQGKKKDYLKNRLSQIDNEIDNAKQDGLDTKDLEEERAKTQERFDKLGGEKEAKAEPEETTPGATEPEEGTGQKQQDFSEPPLMYHKVGAKDLGGLPNGTILLDGGQPVWMKHGSSWKKIEKIKRIRRFGPDGFDKRSVRFKAGSDTGARVLRDEIKNKEKRRDSFEIANPDYFDQKRAYDAHHEEKAEELKATRKKISRNIKNAKKEWEMAKQGAREGRVSFAGLKQFAENFSSLKEQAGELSDRQRKAFEKDAERIEKELEDLKAELGGTALSGNAETGDNGGAYEWLGVEKNASPQEIKEAFREKAKNAHPDRGGDEEEFKKLKAAYDVLGDPDKRKRYDSHGNFRKESKFSIQKALTDMLRQFIFQSVEKALSSGPPHPGLVKRRAKDGHMRWMRPAGQDGSKDKKKSIFQSVADRVRSAFGGGEKQPPMQRLNAAKSQSDVNEYYASLKKRNKSSLTGDEKRFVNSVTLFTCGNVASVRDPGQYKSDLATDGHGAVTGQGFKDGTFRAETGHADYIAANRQITELANRPYGNGPPLWRGMRVSGDELKQLTQGAVVDTYAFSSWSSDGAVALKFSLDPLTGKPDAKSKESGGKDWHDGACVLMRIEKPARGTDITGLSRFPTENETVSGGPVRIDSVQTVEQEHYGVKRTFHILTVSHVENTISKALSQEAITLKDSTLHLPMRNMELLKESEETNVAPDKVDGLDLNILDLNNREGKLS